MKNIGVDLGDQKGDKSAKYIIDTKTIEVKEVDLEAELNKWRHNHFHGRRDKDASGEYLERISQLKLSKHFFELGIKVQKCNNDEKDYDEELKKCKANPLYFFDKYVKVKLKEQNLAWSQEDKAMVEDIIEAIDTQYAVTDYNEMVNWLKSIKDRVQPMQEWSEEDENRFNNLIFLVEFSDESKATKEGFIKFINKLKSLRPQNTWKPTDEQMRILDLAIRCGINRGTTEETTLVSLFNDLKKLREE